MDTSLKPQEMLGPEQQRQTIYELKENLRRVEQQVRLLETTLSHITDFAYVFDKEGRFLYVNQSLLDLWGMPLAEALGKNFFDLKYPDELASKLQLQIQQVFDSGRGLTDETPYTSPTGAGGYFEYIFQPVVALDGTVEMVAGSTRDVTERKLALARSEELLQSLTLERSRVTYIFEHSLSFVAILRGPNHVFELVNPRYRQLIGGREVVGQPVRDAVPEVESQGFVDLLDNVYRTGEPYVGKDVLVRLDRAGRLDDVFLDFVYQPIFEADDTVSGIFVHGVDVTDHVRARKDAEAANRLKDEFLATLSHELRTPLTAVLGWVRMLRSGKLDEPTAAKALDVIQRNADAQLQLIEEVLDVSRIITGKLRLDVRPIDLIPIVEAAVDAIRPVAQSKNIEVLVDMHPETNFVSADPNRLQQVIWNLLTNAIKFTPNEGKVAIRLERCGSNVQIKVIDNGLGISAEFLPHVFDRFRQADSSTTRLYTGLGLGLAVVRHIIEQHSGRVYAESGGKNQGSTFTIELPVSTFKLDADELNRFRSHENAGNLQPDGDMSLKEVRALVVEDQDDARELLAVLFKQYGAEVITAGSAVEALAHLETWNPDVLVSDIGMPGKDGYWLIGEVRALGARTGVDVPAVALTAYASEIDRERALAAGFQAHVSKPIEPAELVYAVAEVIHAARRRRE